MSLSNAEYRFQPGVWVEIFEVDAAGNRTVSLTDYTDGYLHDTIKATCTIEKSLTSNTDTATVNVANHFLLEKIYEDKKMFFDGFYKKKYEMDIMFWHENQPLLGRTNHAIFSGDVDTLSVPAVQTGTDAELSYTAGGGTRENQKVVVNKTYTKGTAYSVVIRDLFAHYISYTLAVLDDPFNKLNKVLKADRTYHGKVSEALDDISREFSMTWGLDCNPWTIPERFGTPAANPLAWQNKKRAYFVDKRSVVDILGMYGKGPFEVSAETGKIGLMGFTKTGISFTHLTDDVLNIGQHVRVTDGKHTGSLSTAAVQRLTPTWYDARVDRISINDDVTTVEATYIGEDGNAVNTEEETGQGAKIL